MQQLTAILPNGSTIDSGDAVRNTVNGKVGTFLNTTGIPDRLLIDVGEEFEREHWLITETAYAGEAEQARVDTLRRRSRIDADAILVHFGGDVVSAGKWDSSFPTAENPHTNLFITDDGVWITIIPNARTNDTFTFGLRIAYPTTGAVLLDDAKFVDIPVDGDRAEAFRDTFADCIVAARAGAVPGMEPLYLTRAKHVRLNRLEYIRDEAREAEQILKDRETLAAILFSLGIDGVTMDRCTLGEWRTGSALWAYNGALVGWHPSADALYVYLDNLDPDDDDIRKWGTVDHPRNLADLEDNQIALLSMLGSASSYATAHAAREIIENSPARSTSAKRHLLPYLMASFFETSDATQWMNDRHAEGYVFVAQSVIGDSEGDAITIVITMKREG